MKIVVITNNGRVAVNAGNSGRLMEMLHGSDGWGKLVSELQQKEEDDVQQAAVQAAEQQPAGKRRKRARNPKEGFNPLAQGVRYATTFCFRHSCMANSLFTALLLLSCSCHTIYMYVTRLTGKAGQSVYIGL